MAENFEEKTSGGYDAFGEKGGLWTPKEEKGHIRSEEEIKAARESIPEEKTIEGKEDKEKKAEEWYETFSKLGGTRGREKNEAIEKEMAQEKKTLEAAEIPKKGMEAGKILKEAGIQKPAESFKEVQERLAERLDRARTFEGKKLSEEGKFVDTRKFYLEELGYSVKYKGVLLDKAEILDENGKSILDDKGKALEFKSFYFNKTEVKISNFLEERLKEKLEGKPTKELTEEQKLEKGYQKATKEVANTQSAREAKISFLQEAKTFGKEKWGKLMEGIVRLSNLREEWDIIGPRVCKKLAIEGGRDLMAIGLSPAMAVEEAGREIVGRIQSQGAGVELRKLSLIKDKIETLKETPGYRQTERYAKLIKDFDKSSKQGTIETVRSIENMYTKGKILRFLEKQGGGFGRAMGERLTPHPSKKEKYE